MQPRFFGFVLGLAGVSISSLIFWWLASSDTSFDSSWLTGGAVLPLFGVYAGWRRARMANPSLEGKFSQTRLVFILQAAFLAGLTQYLAFVIVSGVWNADVIPYEQSGFIYQLFHPDSLPSLARTSNGVSTDSDWLAMVFLGVFAGAATMFWFTRKWNPQQQPSGE
jgi:hypothetical protein